MITRHGGLPPQLESLLALWLGKCAEGGIPRAGDLKAHELAPWQSNLGLIDIAGPGRYRFRQCGIALIRRLGRESTGAFADTLAKDIAQGLIDTLERAFALASPIVSRSRVSLGKHHAAHVDLALPLGDEGGRVGFLLFASYEIA